MMLIFDDFASLFMERTEKSLLSCLLSCIHHEFDKFEVIASNFSRFVSYEVYNQRFEINESLAFLHFLGEKRLTKVDFVIVLGRVFHNVLFSACLFCLLKAFVYDAVWILYFVEYRSAIITKNESK